MTRRSTAAPAAAPTIPKIPPTQVLSRLPANIRLLPLPPYSPELNPAENVWEYLRGNQLSNRVYETYDAIVDACCSAWNALTAQKGRIRSITTREWTRVIH